MCIITASGSASPATEKCWKAISLAIPDLRFNIKLLVCEPPSVASRLDFHCTPKGSLFGLPVNGRKVSFSENVFYEFRDDRIANVWSVIDKAAIEAQI